MLNNLATASDNLCKDKPFRFYYHYNKIVSKKEGRSFLTLHYNNKCLLVNKIICNVSTETHNRKQQPHCIVRGWSRSVSIKTRLLYHHDFVMAKIESY
tara:strand:- start:1234 stop:1527 length:294 start_codon:yes stop_codon:yes gene_type:complete